MKCRNCKHLSWEEEEPGKMFFSWCHKVLYSPDPDIERWCRGFERRTNADRIRDSSDEQLALFCKELMFNDFKPACKKATFFSAEHKPECEEDCVSCIFGWLQQAVEEDI